jgi:Ala-tRNA(Pro) deacylase
LIADPAIGESPQLFFNAGRLDRSIALNSGDYLRIAQPQLAPIAAR